MSSTTLPAADPLATAAVRAIRAGRLEALRDLLGRHPWLAAARIEAADGTGRSLLHVLADWPGHFPNGAATVAALVEAGADVDAPFGGGSHRETPLHWAASSDDVDVLDALLDAGADIDAGGGVIGGGTPLDDAVAFGQWRAAGDSWSAAPAPRSGTPPRSGSSSASRRPSDTARRCARRTSRRRSGRRATAANVRPPSSSSSAAPT